MKPRSKQTSNLFNIQTLSLSLLALPLLTTGCGSSTSDTEDPAAEESGGVTSASGGTTSSPQPSKAQKGDLFLKKIKVTGGQKFATAFKIKSASLNLDAATQSEAPPKDAPIEVNILKPDGSELDYFRAGEQEIKITGEIPESGDYLIGVKTNAPKDLAIEEITESGATSSSGFTNSNKTAKYPDLFLKAIVVFAQECHEYDTNKANSVSVKAPAGSYFVQPFVFYGKVGADKKVELLKSASISIASVYEGVTSTVSLKSFTSIPAAIFKETGGLTDEQHYENTRNFFQGYFGAAGELYTIEQNWLNGDCDALTPVKLPTDVGAAKVSLKITDTSGGRNLDETYPIRPTIAPAFSMYTGAGVKLSDWTQCSYDRATGKPTTYNGDAALCKEFSLKDPPYVTLDYKYPSEVSETDGITGLSDPTRVLYYGHSRPKAFLETLLSQFDSLSKGTVKSVSLDSCYSNGGLVAVPLDLQKTYLPLGELNATKDDVINLAYRTGSYTALMDFYQGDIDASGDIVIPTCLPNGTQSCSQYATITIKVNKCAIKTDSGIATGSIGQSFIYPSYFTMSGIIRE